MKMLLKNALLRKCLIVANEYWYWRRNYKFVIVDDIFPQPSSGFRTAEYTFYLKSIPGTIIYSTGFAFPYVKEERSLREVINEFEFENPSFRNKIFAFSRHRSPQARLGYVMFLHNANYFLTWFEKEQLPFILMLYPGGGFKLNNETSDNELRRICDSPLLRKIIVSQKTTRDYLLEHGFCSKEQLEFIYGCVTPTKILKELKVPRRLYKQQKDTFDVCFVANKYTPKGIDKGYDLFIETAHLISASFPDIKFHVVGTFDPKDIDVSQISSNIFFYGVQPTRFFPEFYAGMDAIISPNRPFVLDGGAFDGFPTAGCVEAGLSGVAVFCSDALAQNIAFTPGREIVLIENDVESIKAALSYYYINYDQLLQLASRGQEAFEITFGSENQEKMRLDLIERLLNNMM